MEVRKDFPKRVASLAESTPREAIANLLSALMPRVPAKTRAPEPYTPIAPSQKPRWADDSDDEEPYTPIPSPMPKLKGKVRTRKPRSARYKVLRHTAYANHRLNTWRRAMVRAVVSCDCEADALNWLAANYPTLADKGVDVPWCVDAGYITFNLGDY